MVRESKNRLLRFYPEDLSTGPRFMVVNVVDTTGEESVVVIAAQFYVSWCLTVYENRQWVAKFQSDDSGWKLAIWLVNHLNGENG